MSRKYEEHSIRSLMQMAGGSSYGISLPISYIRKLGWRARQKLEVTLEGDKIVIKDWKEEKG